MKPLPRQFIRVALMAGLITGLGGCINIKINTHKHGDCCAGQPSGPEPWPIPGYKESFDPIVVGDPIGNGGSLIVPSTSFYTGDGGQGCFPSTDGWNRYFPLPRFILGPGVAPNANSYTNIDQLPQVTISTCDPENGTTLRTGIVIYEEFNPSTDKVCATNIGCLAPGEKLTINQRDLEAGKRYRATVYYKAKTLLPLTSVKIIWSYP